MEKALTLGSGITYGFKRLHIFLYESSGALKKYFVVEGRTGEGASVKLEIDGLSKEPTSTAGSNIIYYQSRKGTSKVTANVTIIDLPYEIENMMLGKKMTTAGVALTGSDTEAPYAAVIGESETTNGDMVLAGLLRGVFRREKFELNTTDPGEDFKPEGVEYGFSAENLKSEDADYDGQVFAQYVGDEAGAEELFKILKRDDATSNVPVTGVTGSQATTSIKVGATKQVTGTVTPSDATNKAVTYASDAESIATVAADGTITGVAEGTANITITSVDGGFTAKVAVTVSAA